MASALLLVAAAAASGAQLMTNVDARKTTSLDGQWPVIVDPYENGYYDYRLEPLPKYLQLDDAECPLDSKDQLVIEII